MKHLIMGIAVLCISSTAVLAGDDECEEVKPKGTVLGYVCPTPDWMKPSSPPKCKIIKDDDGVESLFCDKPFGQRIERDRVKPANCKWRKGEFVCW